MLIFNSKAVVERRGFRPKIFDDFLGPLLVSLGQFLNFLIEFFKAVIEILKMGFDIELYRERVPVGSFRQSASRQVAGDD
ncbi:MAG: hypothetical protein GPI90_21805 [Microcystis aeruginosa K13-05]|jgi:hypothetical protein|uniref:hypothetical protein n=1 Tax=unclassified Microcystis TaxID=2643300 RepID=UPI0005C58561|nr:MULTISPECIES: hypothetical protein [Microcystis]MDJ0564113.1 hypothetical protein [Microcystis sp. M49629_WE12]NCR82415.1 hypothetical protein [Microcystis aeruginosa K13-10]NCR87090.1 hypothetical protein [Microcystis aeruginosa K13-05]MCZ8050264.1 hypothetical protein [Microcystis sp. LE19-41.2A]MCZ8287224.1 hypothetical protein [Microcystis sp. LE19-59.1C]